MAFVTSVLRTIDPDIMTVVQQEQLYACCANNSNILDIRLKKSIFAQVGTFKAMLLQTIPLRPCQANLIYKFTTDSLSELQQ